MTDGWIQRDAPLQLVEGEVQVWSVALDLETAEPDGGRPGLSADERARAARFVVPEPRRVFAQTRAALRGILGAYLGLPGRALRFALAPGGKPRLLEHPEVGFNVSHSGDRALVAVARGVEVGVDMERVTAARDLAGLAARFFHPAERDAVRRAAAPERAAVFYSVWTRKEAVLKASGKGLRVALPSFRVPHDPVAGIARLAWPAGEAAAEASGLAGPWALWSLAAARGYRAALCSRPSIARISWFER